MSRSVSPFIPPPPGSSPRRSPAGVSNQRVIPTLQSTPGQRPSHLPPTGHPMQTPYTRLDGLPQQGFDAFIPNFGQPPRGYPGQGDVPRYSDDFLGFGGMPMGGPAMHPGYPTMNSPWHMPAGMNTGYSTFTQPLPNYPTFGGPSPNGPGIPLGYGYPPGYGGMPRSRGATPWHGGGVLPMTPGEAAGLNLPDNPVGMDRPEQYSGPDTRWMIGPHCMCFLLYMYNLKLTIVHCRWAGS